MAKVTHIAKPGTADSPSRAQRDKARRRRLMDTALALFTERGYLRTPIELLCKESGVTSRYFYQLFGSREALMRATYDWVLNEVTQAVLRALSTAPAAPLRQRIDHGVAAFLNAYLSDPRYAELACIQAIGISADMERHRRRVLRDFAALLEAQSEAARAAGQVPYAERGATMLAIVGAVNELVTDWLFDEPRRPIADLHTDVMRLFDVLVAGLEAAGPRVD